MIYDIFRYIKNINLGVIITE